jgi:AraC-like DNA-binding protein
MQLLLKKIIAEKQKRQTGSDILTKSYFVEFLIALLREQSQSFETNKYPDEIIRVINYIKSNYMHSNPPLGTIKSSSFGTDIFKQLFFETIPVYNITNFIIKHRLLVAKVQLLERDNKIEEIAISTGLFAIYITFSKSVFRGHMNALSPFSFTEI